MISSWLAQLKAEENTEAERSKQSWLEKLGTNSKVKVEKEEGGWRGWNTLLAMRLSGLVYCRWKPN